LCSFRGFNSYLVCIFFTIDDEVNKMDQIFFTAYKKLLLEVFSALFFSLSRINAGVALKLLPTASAAGQRIKLSFFSLSVF
jgi:hypothetical protein